MNPKREHSTFLTIVFLSVVTLVVGGPDAFANDPPAAEAGLPRYAAGESVQLDGSNSRDPDQSGPLSYAWKQISGPSLVLKGADTARPTISGFVQTQEIQTALFELTVTDGVLTSSPDTVKVIIVPMFSICTMVLESAFFDPAKPTVLYFHGGTSEQTGGGYLNRPLWAQKANVISFPFYVGDPGTFSGNATDKSYMRPGDRIIVYLSAVAPDYHQPIQTLGWSIGGLLALDVARRLNLTYADSRYAVNHACLLDPSAWVMGTPEFQRRVGELLTHPVAEEPCWVASLEAANTSVCPSALNIVFVANHALPYNWYLNSLATMEDTPFSHGVLAGAYWSVVGPGRNLQLASTPEVQTYKFSWIGSATEGRMEFFDEASHPGRLPEPVTLGAWTRLSDTSGDVEGVVLSCPQSENAVGYEILLGSDPYRVMDFHVVSDTPLPPMDAIRDLPAEETWWTIRVRDRHGSTIHADPIRLDVASLSPLPAENARTARRYGFISHAILEAEPGDVIVLDPAVYEENIEFGAAPLTIRSVAPNDPVVVAGTIITGRDVEPAVTFRGSENAGSVLDGLTVRGRKVAISCRDAVPTIRNCVVESPDGIALEYWHQLRPQITDCTFVGRVREGGDLGLVAYWKLDETEGLVAHSSEGSNDGTVLGSPTWRPQDGAVGGALELNGTTFVMANSALGPTNGSCSILAWIRGGAPGQVVVSQQGGTNWLMADSASGALTTELSKSGRAGSGLTSQAILTDGNWHRIAFIWDGSKRRLYMDRVLVAEDSQGGLAISSGKLVLGAGKGMAAASCWSGLIDDVRIYDRAVQP